MENELEKCLETIKGIKNYTNSIFLACEEIKKAKNCLSIVEPIKNYVDMLDKSEYILCKNIDYYAGNKHSANMELSEKEKLITLVALRNLKDFILEEANKHEVENIRIPMPFSKIGSLQISKKEIKDLLNKFNKEIDD